MVSSGPPQRRRGLWRLALGLALTAGLSAPSAAAQFHPGGRRKPAKPPRGAPARPATPPREPAEREGPSRQTLIERYTAIVLAQPGAQFPLQRLAQLYRERDGKLATLIAEFEARSRQPGADGWSALIALAGLYHQEGRLEEALRSYAAAIEAKPSAPAPLLALGRLHEARGDKGRARAAFERALPLVQDDTEREQLLRTLLGLALDDDDLPAAKRYGAQLVARAKGSFYARAELGRELLTRGKYAEAVAEYRELVRSASGDHRVLGPALRDLGHALLKLGETTEARSVLERALATAAGQPGLRREVYQLLAELYRSEQRLPELLTELKRKGMADPEALGAIASLSEELGRLPDALGAWRQLLQREPRSVEARLRVIRLLQLQGELTSVIQEYEALLAIAPREPEYVFSLAEALLQHGDRARALATVARLEARARGDDDTLVGISDFYERLGEPARARAVLERLASGGARDPQYLVELGKRYWAEGDQAKALQTWQRLRQLIPDRARAAQQHGEVLLEHGLEVEGLAALEEALRLKPGNPRLRRALALGRERSAAGRPTAERAARYARALGLWEALLAETPRDAVAAREARTKIVTLWGLTQQLEARVAALERLLAATPPDLEAGRLLAEVLLKLQRLPAAEATLRRVIGAAPGDVGSLAALERVLLQQRRLSDAIDVLARLLEADPQRARDYYQRMAQYAAELYRDADAIAYATRAVELAPEDAEGFRRLAELHRRRQDLPRAISAYRQALMRNDRLFSVHLQLADLLIAQGEPAEAQRLLRRVLRSAPDEELVARAARLGTRAATTPAETEALERELLALSLTHPSKPLYRRLLLELYQAALAPLLQALQSPEPARAEAARRALGKLGERAVKPLLDALTDDDEDEQRTALELLAALRHPGAATALFVFATGEAPVELRLRAMTTVAALSDAALLPRLSGWLAPAGVVSADDTDPVTVMAAWAAASLREPKAAPLLLRLSESPAPKLAALGALGLGLLRANSAAASLTALAQAPEAGVPTRAAAVFALGVLAGRGDVTVAEALVDAGDPRLRAEALIALARRGSPRAEAALAEALLSREPLLAAAAEHAALLLVSPGAPLPSPPPPTAGPLDVEQLLLDLRPGGFDAQTRVRAAERLAAALAQAAASAARSSPEQARHLASLLGGSGPRELLPLSRGLQGATPELRQRLERVAERVASAIEPAFLALAQHSAPELRRLAIEFLATRATPEARAALLGRLHDEEVEVRRAALDAITRARPSGVAGALLGLVSDATEPAWPLRRQAALALGAELDGAAPDAVREALTRALDADPYALVREAAAIALGRRFAQQAAKALRRAAAQDPEARVRGAARRALGEAP